VSRPRETTGVSRTCRASKGVACVDQQLMRARVSGQGAVSALTDAVTPAKQEDAEYLLVARLAPPRTSRFPWNVARRAPSGIPRVFWHVLPERVDRPSGVRIQGASQHSQHLKHHPHQLSGAKASCFVSAVCVSACCSRVFTCVNQAATLFT